MKSIGIVGGGITEEELKERGAGYELWSVNNLYGVFPETKFAAWFELHDIVCKKGRFLRRGYGQYPIGSEQTVRKYLGRIGALGCPVYMQRPWRVVKKSRAFPFQALIAQYGTYWGCSFAWMTAFAMEQGAGRIGYFGVRLEGNEYYYQRPSTEYLVGVATGRKIEVVIDESSNLLKGNYLYGVQESADMIYMLHGGFTRDLAHTILTATQQKMEETL